MKEKILEMIIAKIVECEARTRLAHGMLKVDRIDVVALKELGQSIEKLEFNDWSKLENKGLDTPLKKW